MGGVAQVDLGRHPAVDHEAVAAARPEGGHRLVDLRPVDPERVLDPRHRPGAPLAQRPEALAEPVELLARMRLEADVVGIPAAGKFGPAERDRPGRARHVGVAPLLGEQRPARRPGRALRVLEAQEPRVQGDVRDETARTQADPRAVPFGVNITGVRREFAHQGQCRLRPRALAAVPAQADPDHPVRDRGHPHGQVVPVAGLPGEDRLAARRPRRGGHG